MASSSFSRPCMSESIKRYLSSISTFIKDAQSKTEMPWWALLATGTILLRSVSTLPLAVLQRQRILKLNKVDSIVKAWSRSTNWSMDALKQKRKQLYIAQKCSPYTTILLPYTQIPLFVTVSLSLRNLFDGNQFIPGIAWCGNFSVVDPYCVLPVTTCLLHLSNIQLQYSMMDHELLRVRLSKFVMRLFSLVVVPIGSILPSGLCFYWVVSAAYSLALNFGLKKFLK